ncbi:TrmH family RNA methyltransferase [Chitinophaga pinensis]|uniref:tRNA/rRNA methyltransferase (SpoU) n=1 Tax=Chitinophaga pinensis (strain ATCC 43595 / DSM 2588 / LMG 13176 / NBRC 15968 / NCIMB 11800 / UQM 2034) TaxID=485918 RepID=A0A979G1T0_CHIPD|nr:tRNA/rRNA methyltransferase (SpoU) [Chitinophaga pinensis DSM 2588]
MLSKAQIKYIQSLQHKKYRQKSSQFMAEGDKIVPELLQEGVPVKEVYATSAWIAAHRALLDRTKDVNVTEVDENVLRQLSALTTPNQAIALLDIPGSAAIAPGSLKGTVSLALETIQDPGNLGTIIRIADWFGIRQIICTPDCVDAYNPKTIQATMGSIARVKILESDISTLIKEAGVPSYAATLHGRDITEFSKLEEGIILIGNESRGLSEAVISASTHKITIPRLGGAESLNAGVAAGIICGRLLI